MALVVSDAGERWLLDVSLGTVPQPANGDLEYRLYANDWVPTPETVEEDLVEATYAGYAPTGALNWTPAITAGGVARSTADPIEYVKGVGLPNNICYGYYVTVAGGPFLLSERFPEPVSMEDAGSRVTIVPTIRSRTFAS